MGETDSSGWISIHFFLVSLILPSALGHGALMWPPSWFDPNGTIGLTPGGFMEGQYEFAPNMWYTDWTFIPGEATLDPSLYTFPDFHGDAIEVWDRVHCFNIEELGQWSDVCPTWYPTYMEKNPWMAPGSAEVFSPCGIAGGNPFGIEGCDDHDHDKFCTWGGYSWGPGGVTEECFQKTPLKFASENSWVQYGYDEDARVVFKANRTTQGTFPEGSEWTMNPIPVCNSTDIGWLNPDCPHGFEFPPRGTGLHGVGEVEVPADLEPGEYVLSFRWD